MRQFIGIFLLLLTSFSTISAQEKIYQLQHKKTKSKINQTDFKKLSADQLRNRNEIEFAFSKPQKGKAEVYFFIATYQGNSFDGTTKTFHDYMVLEVDPKTQLINDGYQYTLEWTDSPYIDLYRIHNKITVLKDGLKIDRLDFRCFDTEPSDFRYLLNETGRLQLQ